MDVKVYISDLSTLEVSLSRSMKCMLWVEMFLSIGLMNCRYLVLYSSFSVELEVQTITCSMLFLSISIILVVFCACSVLVRPRSMSFTVLMKIINFGLCASRPFCIKVSMSLVVAPLKPALMVFIYQAESCQSRPALVNSSSSTYLVISLQLGCIHSVEVIESPRNPIL